MESNFLLLGTSFSSRSNRIFFTLAFPSLSMLPLNFLPSSPNVSVRSSCSESLIKWLNSSLVWVINFDPESCWPAELGDFDPMTQEGYLSELKLLPKQSKEVEERAAQIHRGLVGRVPAAAELLFLDRVKWLDLYGADLHPVLVSLCRPLISLPLPHHHLQSPSLCPITTSSISLPLPHIPSSTFSTLLYSSMRWGRFTCRIILAAKCSIIFLFL